MNGSLDHIDLVSRLKPEGDTSPITPGWMNDKNWDVKKPTNSFIIPTSAGKADLIGMKKGLSGPKKNHFVLVMFNHQVPESNAISLHATQWPTSKLPKAAKKTPWDKYLQEHAYGFVHFGRADAVNIQSHVLLMSLTATPIIKPFLEAFWMCKDVQEILSVRKSWKISRCNRRLRRRLQSLSAMVTTLCGLLQVNGDICKTAKLRLFNRFNHYL